jgi:hypothetical protein
MMITAYSFIQRGYFMSIISFTQRREEKFYRLMALYADLWRQGQTEAALKALRQALRYAPPEGAA